MLSKLIEFSPDDDDPEVLSTFTDSLPSCMFGMKCYRRNPNHFEAFSHPHLDGLISARNNGFDQSLRKLVSAGADEATIKDQVCGLLLDLRSHEITNHFHLTLRFLQFWIGRLPGSEQQNFVG